jgi:integrase
MPKGSTQRDANEKCGELEKLVRRQPYTPAKQLALFSGVADSWLASKKPDLRHTTHDQYRGHLENHLNPYFGHLKIHQVSFDLIERFKGGSLDKGVTPPTLRNVLTTLGGVLKYAVRCRYIDYDPSREVVKPRGQSVHSEKDGMVILKPEEIQRLLGNADDHKARVLFMTAVLTGMREGELLGLQWGDINWRSCRVHVRRTFNHGHFYEPKSKTSRRKIDLAPELLGELKKWKLACPPSEKDLVFPTRVGTPESASNMLRRRFFPALRRAGLSKFRFHALRHTYASLLIAQGEHPNYIQTQLGHSSIQVTMVVYGHLMDPVNQEAASRLGKTVLGTKAKAESGVGR